LHSRDLKQKEGKKGFVRESFLFYILEQLSIWANPKSEQRYS